MTHVRGYGLIVMIFHFVSRFLLIGLLQEYESELNRIYTRTILAGLTITKNAIVATLGEPFAGFLLLLTKVIRLTGIKWQIWLRFEAARSLKVATMAFFVIVKSQGFYAPH